MPNALILSLPLAAALVAASPDQQPFGLPLEGEEAERFLATARIVRMKPVGVGITNPYKAYLTNGDQTIKAIWKSTTKPVLFSSGSKAPSPRSSAEKNSYSPKTVGGGEPRCTS